MESVGAMGQERVFFEEKHKRQASARLGSRSRHSIRPSFTGNVTAAANRLLPRCNAPGRRIGFSRASAGSGNRARVAGIHPPDERFMISVIFHYQGRLLFI